MSITIDMPAQEIAALKELTRLESDAEAVVAAAREFLRLSRLRELKAASGKVELEANWQEPEGLEVVERQEALRQLIGIWKSEHPPDDEEVERILNQETMKKYG